MTIYNIFISYLKNKDGATAIEYGLLVTLIAIVAIGGISSVGFSLGLLFEDAADDLVCPGPMSIDSDPESEPGTCIR